MNVTKGFNNSVHEKLCDNCLLTYLVETVPEFVKVVPKHWLLEDVPFFHIQTIVALLLLVICVPANIAHILIFVAYGK